MLGQLTGGGLRAYYRLENTNDNGPNGYNLTNYNTVGFGSGRYSQSAQFGSSGTNKGLSYSGNICSSTIPIGLGIICWFKLNNISSSNSNARILHLLTGLRSYQLLYNISGGNITLTARVGINTSFDASVTIPADTKWHHVLIIRGQSGGGEGTAHRIIVDFRHTANSNSGNQTIAAAMTIGNVSALSLQVWADVDEVIVAEGSFFGGFNTPTFGNSARQYSQAIGRFCI